MNLFKKEQYESYENAYYVNAYSIIFVKENLKINIKKIKIL